MAKLSTILIVVGLAAALPTTALAAIIGVPADQPTIQAAYGAAVQGDTILLSDGVYTGNGNRDIELLKSITIMSVNGPEHTIIDLEGSAAEHHRAFRGWRNITLAGITFRNGYHEDGGVLQWWVHGDYTVIHRDCIFENNYSPIGGAIYVHGGVTIIIEECKFLDNNAFLGGGAMFAYWTSIINVTSCFFSGNSSPLGGAIHWVYPFGAVLANCTFDGNTGSRGGAVFWHADSNGTVTNTNFVNNSAQNGSGIYCWEAAVTVSNCTFSANDADSGIIFCSADSSGPATPIIENSIVAFNSAGGAVACSDVGYMPTLACCNIYGNDGGDWVGCIADQGDTNGNLSLDPLFCNRFTGNLYLRDDSPCLPANNSCSVLIGAFGSGCGFMCGDTNGDSSGPNVVDLTYLVDYLFGDGPPPSSTEAANVDGENGLNIADVSYFADYLFSGGPPLDCP